MIHICCFTSQALVFEVVEVLRVLPGAGLALGAGGQPAVVSFF